MTFADIANKLVGKLEMYKIPVVWQWIDAVPKTHNGKIQTRWLVVLFMAGVMLMAVKARCFGNMVLFQGLTTLIIPLILLPVWTLIPDRPWPRFLVSTSFGVYLVHMFFVRVAQHFAAGWLQTLVGFVLGYLLIVVCSVFFVLAIKRLVPRLAMLAFGGR